MQQVVAINSADPKQILRGDVGVFRCNGEMDALLLDYCPRNSPHAAMVQPASETECLIPVAAGVRMRLSLTTNNTPPSG